MNQLLKLLACSLLFLLLPIFNLQAQMRKTIPYDEMEVSEPVAIVLLTIIVLLLCVILVLASALKTLPVLRKKQNEKRGSSKVFMLLLGGSLMLPSLGFGQGTEAMFTPGSGLIGGISSTSFYLLFSIIILELLAIFALAYAMRAMAKPITIDVAAEAIKEEKKTRKKYDWFEKLNQTKSLDAESEAAISLGHDYDGIGELDNPTPPWWKWGFRLSVVFAFVYMWVYFVGQNAPLQLEELAIANEKAEIAKEAYLASSGNRVDENNVTLLTDENELAAGQALYLNSCAACHLDDGGGSIGPNLTDNYFLHGNHINDIFKTVKYGIQGTGMKSWENDFSAKQIAQISSFVHSLIGTTPKAGKEPEGELVNGGNEEVQETAETAAN